MWCIFVLVFGSSAGVFVLVKSVKGDSKQLGSEHAMHEVLKKLYSEIPHQPSLSTKTKQAFTNAAMLLHLPVYKTAWR
jgi:hypothetical protein